MKKRLAIITVVILLTWVLLACSLSQLRPERQAGPSATPTRTPKPTFTATVTATQTLTPSPTPTPSNTPTSTPIPTDTPIATATPMPTLSPTITPTPLPSNTPTATVRPTRRPTARPTTRPTPRPTNTPAPPFVGRIVGGSARCDGYTAVTGFVKHANGSPYPGVAVGVWSDIWQGRVSTAEPDGKYDISLGGVPPGTFKVAVVRLETCGQRDGAPTAMDCAVRSNIISVVTTEQCSGAGASQVPMVDFTGP
jgi:hypothetical protein